MSYRVTAKRPVPAVQVARYRSFARLLSHPNRQRGTPGSESTDCNNPALSTGAVREFGSNILEALDGEKIAAPHQQFFSLFARDEFFHVAATRRIIKTLKCYLALSFAKDSRIHHFVRL